MLEIMTINLLISLKFNCHEQLKAKIFLKNFITQGMPLLSIPTIINMKASQDFK